MAPLTFCTRIYTLWVNDGGGEGELGIQLYPVGAYALGELASHSYPVGEDERGYVWKELVYKQI